MPKKLPVYKKKKHTNNKFDGDKWFKEMLKLTYDCGVKDMNKLVDRVK